MAAYARKYVRELREMNYPHSEDIVNSHWSDLCSTLLSGIRVNSKRIVRSQPPSKATPTSTVFEFSKTWKTRDLAGVNADRFCCLLHTRSAR